MTLPARYSRTTLSDRRPWSPAQKRARRLVQEAIRVGRYTYVRQSCPCGSEDDTQLATTERHGLEHRTVLCQNCGLVRTDPRLSDESYSDFYKNYYTLLYAGSSGYDESSFAALTPVAEERYSWIQRHAKLHGGEVVLEIGCGSGVNLNAWHHRGHVAFGYDHSSGSLKFGRQKIGLDLRDGSTKQALRDGVSCDLLVLSHVAEHFGDVVEQLSALHPLLRPDSLIYIEVPSIWQVGTSLNPDPLLWFRLAHVWSFCYESLCVVMQRAGYANAAFDTVGTIKTLWRAASRPPVAEIDLCPGLAGRILQHIETAERRRKLLAPISYVREFGMSSAVRATKALRLYRPARRIWRALHRTKEQ